jgi:thiol-disulfide isomerase/thioredoxin
MKSLTVVALTLFLLIPVLPACSSEKAADWTLLSASEENVMLSEEIRQQPVVLFFWATWCPYCKALMPHLQSIRQEYGDDVKILAINFRDDKDPAAFIKSTGYDFTVLLDGDDVAKLYEIWGTPGVIIVDQKQRIRFDLRAVPDLPIPGTVDFKKHSSKAAYIAPYWAAQIRHSLDTVLQESAQ